ncbi:hypothetical protein GCM10023353_16760 [Tomitella cavernea]|uniref:Uncharacterized protein n=1 Tax=Tomitella cavernea TaxID=1387982 RepID=A0ABP9CJJ8_9ACTN
MHITHNRRSHPGGEAVRDDWWRCGRAVVTVRGPSPVGTRHTAAPVPAPPGRA